MNHLYRLIILCVSLCLAVLLTPSPNAIAGDLNVTGNLSVTGNVTAATMTLGNQNRSSWPSGGVSVRLYARAADIPATSTILPVAPAGNYMQFSATTDRITYEFPMPPQFNSNTAVSLIYHYVSADSTNTSGTQEITVLTPSQVSNWPPTPANFDSASAKQTFTISTSGVISQQLNVTVSTTSVFSNATASGMVAVQIKPTTGRLHWFRAVEINQGQ